MFMIIEWFSGRPKFALFFFFMSKPLTPSEQREIDATYDLVHQAAMNGIDQDFDDWMVHPMFRDSLPEDIDKDKYLSCFQTVMYENETHDSLALHFKELGNELYRSGKQNWLAASNWWTRGLEENPADPKLRSVLHSNRATVSLGLQQYQKAALDADWAIKYDNTNKKAFMRAAHAYQGMSNWDKALAAANAGLEGLDESDPLYKGFNEVIKTVSEQMNSVNTRVQTYLDSVNSCSNYFKKQGVSIGKFPNTWMGNWDLSLRFDEDKNETIWPVAIEYDEVLQIDFVEGFSEGTPLRDLINQVLPGVTKGVEAAPWDTESRYTVQETVIYVKTNSTAWQWGRKVAKRASKNIEIDPDCSLRQIFAIPDYVIPGYPILYLAVRKSWFAKSLNITEKYTPTGKVPVEPIPEDQLEKVNVRKEEQKEEHNDLKIKEPKIVEVPNEK
ncbi:hypothetical protein TRFO_16586 [Tritrichomonas foetus]|uniref:Cns1/TTC4 wheel domain-containing protein n=1 Tax=Tritrichomonas foetus TaxID=1144522 RepID=A0A1J4KPQ2_9EUKA|nr:hypothetical protein TRFO_16586 [Tritrichomonas foetus]|eukprot:OHT13271.1 hypothetical protein TRFO_16586 [Tritrichomonas foetus]